MIVRRIFLCLFTIGCMSLLHGQENTTHSLHYYIETAQSNSPLLQDYHNRKETETAELQRLKALYTHSKTELNGDALFVPIISKDNGKTTFQWNAHNGTDYYGYDLGENSGNIHAYVSWTQPLLGNRLYKATKEQTEVRKEMINHSIHMERHQLEYVVAQQYILCLQDRQQIAFADSIGILLEQQTKAMRNLAEDGLVKQTDLRLLLIEQKSNQDLRTASLQSFRTHLADLNILCGIKDTTLVVLQNISLTPHPVAPRQSAFMEQYRLDSLNTLATLKIFHLQYHPQLNLFINSGFSSGKYNALYKHFGMSAGLTFAWTLADGRQKRYKELQSASQLRTIAGYKNELQNRKEQRKHQYLDELQAYDERTALLQSQRKDYAAVLEAYRREIEAGQLSIIDYLNVWKSKIQTDKDYMLLQTNRQLLVAAFNYWNW
ncbi:TolC family protein [Bacteroides helcogenes]|uniref:Outer membrane efflux protein n=1 Tax=Bacteroides helcogenes (strain ATCC 35417 / DSM 20613 / JCM 6297 / CCUG 15421 / P 36-108) TaxID=693979 RepID=E6SRN4_BACT6|nr:TolC family protein [Bacteroides helcogenes]ADV45124.1 hypothetical protein Bache_3200 [Bacteroides helcogenes P 36-108]MDY5238683.1 TolC family protein [Bacteroides helcogenes]